MATKTKKGKKSKKSKKSVPAGSVAFNVSVPKSLLPKIDKDAQKYAKTAGLTKASRSAYVRHRLSV